MDDDQEDKAMMVGNDSKLPVSPSNSPPATKKVKRSSSVNNLQAQHQQPLQDKAEQNDPAGGELTAPPSGGMAVAAAGGVNTKIAETLNALKPQPQREYASKLLQQQQQQQQQQPHPSASAGTPLMYQPSGAAAVPFVDPSAAFRFAGAAGAGMPLLMPSPNFVMQPQWLPVAAGGHPFMFLPQAPAAAFAHPASGVAMNMMDPNMFGMGATNVNGYLGGGASMTAPGQFPHLQYPLMMNMMGGTGTNSAAAGLTGNAKEAPPAFGGGAQTMKASKGGGSRNTPSGSGQVNSHRSFKVFPMALDSDEDSISRYQCILRQQIEFFEASPDDLRARAQGRNVPIRLAQVGIRCIHCAKNIPAGYRPRGAVYFPVKLTSLYQSAQNMANNHFNGSSCSSIPEATVKELNELKRNKNVAGNGGGGGGGQRYWVETARELGIIDSVETGLELRDSGAVVTADGSRG